MFNKNISLKEFGVVKNKKKIKSQILKSLNYYKNYELEKRIQDLEDKFSQDLSEDTFNQLKELKKLQNLN